MAVIIIIIILLGIHLEINILFDGIESSKQPPCVCMHPASLWRDRSVGC